MILIITQITFVGTKVFAIENLVVVRKKNSVLVKETTFFVFKIVSLNNNYANVDSFKYILQLSKECSL